MSFPRYPTYKDSGVSWLTSIPSHWAVVQLRYLVDCLDGQRIPLNSAERSDRKGDVPYWGANNVQDYIDSHLFDEELVLLGEDGAPFFDRTKPVAFRSEGRIWPNNHIHVLRPRTKGESAFLTYCLNATDFADYVDGSTRDKLTQSAMNRIAVTLPSNEERAAIVHFLDRETAKIDALVAEQDQLITLLKEKRQAVISHAVTKGLDPSVPMKDSGVEWLGEVPAHWEIGGLTKFIGPVVDYRGRTPTKVDDGIFLVTARNVRDGRIDYNASEEYVDAESAASLLGRGAPEIGDLLFTMEAPLGQAALIDRTDIALAQRIVKFRGLASVMSNKFLLVWIMSGTCQARLETLATGSTALGIKASKLGQIECLAPPLDEQADIVAHIDHETARIDSLVAEAKAGIVLLQERRSALISAAVTGQIDVRGLATQEAA